MGGLRLFGTRLYRASHAVTKVGFRLPFSVRAMAFLLFVLAIGMIAIGLAAMTFGMSIVQVERGWTMVISGAVGGSAGAVLLGIAFAVQRLGRIANELLWIRDKLATIGEMTAETVAFAPTSPPEPEDAPEAEPAPEAVVAPSPPPPSEPPPPPERVVVGQYSSGGNEYKMYEDGSIDALTPAGLRSFASLEELRAFVAGGGERAS